KLLQVKNKSIWGETIASYQKIFEEDIFGIKMKIVNKIKSKKILMWTLIIVAILIIFSAGIIIAINTRDTGFRVIAGGPVMKIDVWGVCRNVDNNLAHDIFVPTKTSIEWSEFRIHYPAGVVLTDCVECVDAGDCIVIYDGCRQKMKCLNGFCCSLTTEQFIGCPPICAI
ncbi:unnamed protein product, partial [marine sediment metagenome]